jgi:hypothetical protein
MNEEERAAQGVHVHPWSLLLEGAFPIPVREVLLLL